MNQQDKTVVIEEKHAGIDPEARSEAMDVTENSPGQVQGKAAEKPQAEKDRQGGENVQTEPLPLAEYDHVKTLQDELDKERAKVQENWNLYLKARAEAENIRKRAERDLQNAHKYALDKFVNELLPVRDSLEMGIAAANEVVDVNKLREGSELTLKMLTGVMEKFGVQEVNPLGEKFNPDRHEAMAMQPSEQAEPNTVLQVIQKGYMLNDRLIRPAMVIVARAVPKKE